MFHGVRACCGSKVRLCCDVQVFAGQVLHASQRGGPEIVKRIECRGAMSLLRRVCLLVEDGVCEPLHGLTVVCWTCLMQPCVHVDHTLVV